MRIAIISDIHGNRAALDAVLNLLSRSKVDQIVCAGDTVDPMPQSREVLEFLLASNIPTLRGNHEDYVVDSFFDPNSKMNTTVQYRPVQVTASSFDKNSIEQVKTLPFTVEFQSKRAGSLLICHASPKSNIKGWRYGIDDQLSKELATVPHTTLACGHWHDPETKIWNGKKLITVGSVGVPLEGKLRPDFCILDDQSGQWEAEHLSCDYDPTPTLEIYSTSGWLKQGGPVGWLLFYEVASASRTIKAVSEMERREKSRPRKR
jgi:putative phosphoesterase